MEIIKKDFNYNSEIKHIIHISDIHIPLFKRHDEYLEVFETLYLKIKNIKSNLKIKKNRDIPLIMVITGDLLHSKTDLSPECISITYNFIKNLLKILPVVIIPGNHDVNMNNIKRLDSITPILADLANNEQLYYLVNTGIYTLNNIIFSHASIFDYNIIPADEINSDKTKIALFHGRINGVETNNGFTLSGEVSKNTNKTITVSAFNNYDMVLLGDIHNHQFIKESVAYAGSLIQQNISEDLNKHGLILWDVENKKGEFHRIKNNYGYLEVVIDDKQVEDTYFMTKDESNPNIPKNIRLRVLYKNTPLSYVEDFIAIAKIHHNVIDVYHNNIDTNIKKNNNSSNLMQINLTSPDEQNKYIESYLKEYTNATDDDISIIKQQNIRSNENIDIEKVVELRNFKLVRLEFSNLFSYGINNHITFNDLNGIVGIIADNHMGKSSILEILLFGIYDKFSRKGGIKDMINNRRNNFKIHVVLKIEDFEYHIVKSGTRNKSGGVTQKLSFYRTKGNINECLDEDTISKTKNTIQKYFGYYNDIVNTNFSIQNDSNQFIDSENTARKKELERILNIDFIDELYKKANDAFSKNKYLLEHISKKVNPELGSKLAKDKKQFIEELETIRVMKEKCETILSEKRSTLLTLNQSISNTHDIKLFDIDILRSNLNNLKSNETDLLLQLKEIKENNSLDSNQIKCLDLDKIYDNIFKLDKTFNDTNKKYNTKIEKYNELIIKNNKEIKEIQEGDFNEDLNNIQSKIKKSTEEISTLGYDIEKKKDIDKNIQKYEEDIKTQQNIYLELQKETLPDSLNTFLTSHKLTTLKKSFKKDEETLFDRIKVDSSGYETCPEYKKYSTTSEKYYFHKELNSYNKNNGKQERNIKNNIENLNINLDTAKQEKEKIQKYKINLVSKKKELESLEKDMSRIQTIIKNNVINKKHNEIIEIELKKNNDGLIKYKKALQELEVKYNEDKVKVNMLQSAVNIRDKLNKLNDNIKLINKDIEIYDKNIDIIEKNKTINLDIQKITNDISLIEVKHKEMEISFNKANANLSQTLTQIKQFKTDNQERKGTEKKKQLNSWYKDSLKRLPYYIIQNVVPIIEKKANDLLSVISDFNILFEINDNKIDIYLKRSIYGDINIILNNASGFEKFVSSLAIRLAILSVSNLPKINFIAIDEGWSCLDNHNVNNVKTILEYISQNFDFVLTISHLTEIKQHCDHQILLKKDDSNYSCVNYN